MNPLDGALSMGYVPPGPVARAFIQDTQHRLVGIMGPNGSGKTSSCPIKAQVITRLQPPNKHDGVIRSNGYVIRPTYPDLWGKTIPSWKKVFPDIPDWKFEGSVNRPAKQVVKWDEARPWGRQRFEMIVNFVAVGDAAVEDFARGLLATWIWLNEADTFPEDAVDFLLGRLGRYPEPHHRPDNAGPGFGCVMCDFNAPNSNNWTYTRLLMGRLRSGKASGAKCYVQPSGLAPNAENPSLRKNDPGYYDRMAAEMEEWQVRRFIENRPGYARTGEPVYGGEFDYEKFVLQNRRHHARGSPILIGIDGKLNAACVFGQRDWRGQLTVLRSLVTPKGKVTDAQTFGERVKEILAGEFGGSVAIAMIDPANLEQKESADADLRSWGQIFQEAAGIPVVPMPTNKLERRHRAVRNLLKGSVGAEPTLLINEDGNEDLIEGFIAGYRIRKLKSGEDPSYQDQPDKNHFSHVHDAMQALAFLAGGDPEFLDLAIEYQAEIIQQLRAERMGGSVGAGGAVNVINDW